MAVARKNPYAAYNFVVTLDGSNIGGFMEVSGLDTENAIIEYREGADQTSGAFVRKLPGMERYPNITLRRGITGDLKLWNDLRKKIRDADIGPQLGSPGQATPSLKIDLQDEKHNSVQSWTLQNVWVSKLTGPSLNAKGNEIAVESIEVVCDRIELS
ncbi:MAG: phage tail protein [Nitrospira sp.]|nr:phage tail protein [Nitrospira sp.]